MESLDVHHFTPLHVYAPRDAPALVYPEMSRYAYKLSDSGHLTCYYPIRRRMWVYWIQ